MTKLINEDIVGFDITKISTVLQDTSQLCSPMDEPEIVYRFNGKDTLCHVEFGHVF